MNRGGEVIASDSNGVPIVRRTAFGAGNVCFYHYWDHRSAPEALALTKALMSYLGQERQGEFGPDDSYGINRGHWYDAKTDIQRLYLLNVNWVEPRTSRGKACP